MIAHGDIVRADVSRYESPFERGGERGPVGGQHEGLDAHSEVSVDFIPQVLESIDAEHVYICVAMRVKVCATCRRPMIPAADRMPLYSAGGPHMSVLEQAKRAGWPEITMYAHNVDGRQICDECAVEGHAKFRCALCQQERDRTEIKARFGTNAEYLCKPCFETVPASRWEAKAEDLAQKHRFDFE